MGDIYGKRSRNTRCKTQETSTLNEPIVSMPSEESMRCFRTL